MVSYSIIEHKSKIEYKKNSSNETIGKSCTHYITIKNNNNSYSNSFAVRLVGKEYNESTKNWKDIKNATSYVSINPQSTYTFSIKHSDWWRNESSGYDEGNVSISIMQNSSYVYKTVQQRKTVKRKLIHRADELILKDTIVSNCECDIDVLKAEYKVIQDIYQKFKNEKLIKTE
jgi:hypothetical protein